MAGDSGGQCLIGGFVVMRLASSRASHAPTGFVSTPLFDQHKTLCAGLPAMASAVTPHHFRGR
jgi:hypothetical protein